LGAAETLLEESGAPLAPPERAAYERNLASVRARLDQAAFAAAWAAGRALTLAQATGEAFVAASPAATRQ
jgi:hypothetical protein